MTAYVVDLDVPAHASPFVEAGRFADADVELAGTVTRSEGLGLVFHVRGEEPDTVDPRTGGDAGSVRYVGEVGTGVLYYSEWTPDEDDPFGVLLTDEATLLGASERGGTWTVLIQFASAEAFERVRNRVAERGIECRVDHLYRNPGYVGESLTASQREAITTALELGYFDIPRGASMSELADVLGVTQNAVSERLRRAQRAVFGEMFSPDDGGE